MEEQLLASSQFLKKKNPKFKEQENLLAAMKNRLEELKQARREEFDSTVFEQRQTSSSERLKTVKAQIERNKQLTSRLKQKLDEEDKRTIAVGRKQLQISELQQQMSLAKELEEKLGRRIQELEMKSKQRGRISLAQKAQALPAQDKRMKLSAGIIFMGFAAGAGLAFLRDKADKRIKTPQQVSGKSGIRIIGTTTNPRAVKLRALPEQIIKDYENIFANLDLINENGMPQMAVVTSPSVGDGKTTCSVNIAGTLARGGKNVLLTDGDMRKSELVDLLGLGRKECGLQNVLLGEDPEKAVCRSSRGNFDVLVTNPASKLDNVSMCLVPVIKVCSLWFFAHLVSPRIRVIGRIRYVLSSSMCHLR